MKRYFFIAALLLFSLITPKQTVYSYSGAECAYCGMYFIFGDPEPMMACLDRVQACFKESARMPGESSATCMCRIQSELRNKYNKPSEMKKHVKNSSDKAGEINGKTLPVVGFLNAQKRELLESGDMGAFEFIDVLAGDNGGDLLTATYLDESKATVDSQGQPAEVEVVSETVDEIFGGSGDFVLTYFDLGLENPVKKASENEKPTDASVNEKQEILQETSYGNSTQALIDEIPSDANEFAKFMDSISPLKIEETTPSPSVSEPKSQLEPGSDSEKKISSYPTNNPNYYVDYYLDSGGVNFILPDGKVIEGDMKSEESISLPPGTKIATDKFAKLWLDVSRNGEPVGVSMHWDSQLTIEELEPGYTGNLKVNKGFVRFYPKGPVEILTPEGVSVTNEQTDFGVSFDPITKQTAVEIYNGKIKIESPVGKRTLSTSYGLAIKRLEIEQRKMEEKIAVPASKWSGFLTDQKKKRQNTQLAQQTIVESDKGFKFSFIYLIIPAVIFIGLSGFLIYNRLKKR